jgi:AraC-like DNA-binding protein
MFRRFERELGACADRLGVTRDIFRRPDISISIEHYLRMLECAARSTDASIGFTMGSTLAAGDLGPLGHAAAAAATVRDMLSLLSNYLYVFAHANVLRIDIGQRRFAAAYDATDPIVVHQQDVELALTFVITQIRALTGSMVSPKLVEFEHDRPDYARTMARHFGCNVAFRSGGNRAHYANATLDLPIRSSDPSLRDALEFYLRERLKVRGEDADLGHKAAHLIATSLSRGVPDIGDTATTLGVSARTLQRRLKEEGLVFKDMVETIRRGIARQYVHHSDVALTDIALMLGYSELSAFSRAFRRWTGESPRQARAKPALQKRRAGTVTDGW